MLIKPRLAAPAASAARPALCGASVVLGACLAAFGATEPWPEITAAERALTALPQDPDAGAVVLNYERNGRILTRADDRVNILRYHWRMKVINERGLRYGEVHISAEKYSRVSDIEARTVRADGSVVPVTPDQIHEKVVLQVGSYRRVEWVFHFPAVEPGVILEYRYTRHDNFLLYIDPWYFEGPEFTLRSRVTQGVPEGFNYAILCDLCESTKPAIANWRDGDVQGQMITVEMRDLRGYREEVLMPPPREVSPHLEMVLQGWKNQYFEPLGRQDRLFIDWASVTTWVRFRYEKARDAGLPQMKPLAAKWIEGIEAIDRRIDVLVRHVREDFRYIPFRSVGGGTRSVADLLRDGTADNEEKAVLLLTALQAIGVEANAALVVGRDRGSLNPKFFSLSQFTHAIVAIQQPEGGLTFLDPTISYAATGFLPWYDAGADYLLIRGPQGEFGTLPAKAERSASKYRVELTPGRDGGARLEIHATFVGEDAQKMRDRLVPESESGRLEALAGWLEDMRPGATLRSARCDSLEQVDAPLVLHMEADAPGLVTIAEDVIAVRTCVLSCYETNPIRPGARQHPLYVDEGWIEEQVVNIAPPEGMVATQPPPSTGGRTPVATFSTSCEVVGDGSISCSRNFSARRNRWAPSEMERMRGLLDNLVQADRAVVAFSAAPPG